MTQKKINYIVFRDHRSNIEYRARVTKVQIYISQPNRYYISKGIYFTITNSYCNNPNYLFRAIEMNPNELLHRHALVWKPDDSDMNIPGFGAMANDFNSSATDFYDIDEENTDGESSVTIKKKDKKIKGYGRF